MASTYSALKIELIGTGDQSGTWGATTNVNLGTALEEAIVGRANAVFASDADLTITLTNANTTQVARNYILNVTSGVSLSATRNLIVPTIDKPYIIENNTTGAQSIIVKTAAGTGVTVPNGRKVMVYADGTNVVPAFNEVPSGTTVSGEGAIVGTTGTQTLTNKSLTSPSLTGTPTAPTAVAGTNTTQIATTAHVFAERTNTATLTNKTLSGANNTFSNIGNSSLTNSSLTVNGTTIALGASGTITAANPQALTIGTGLSGTSYNGSSAVTVAIDSTVATLTGTQTLTNKTISGSNNTITNISLTTGVTGTLPILNGGTGATTATDARSNLQITAINTPYSNTTSGLPANNVQSAIDQVVFLINLLDEGISIYSAKCEYIDVKDCTFSDSLNRTALAINSTNSGNNTGWAFI